MKERPNSIIEKIKTTQGAPKVIKNFLDKNEIQDFLELYKKLPITLHNKKQNVIKKRWLLNYEKKLEKLFVERLKNEIGDFKMDNLKTDEGADIYGLFQESYSPLKLHADSGFDAETLIYKQTLIPLSSFGETIIFKNRHHGLSTNFTLDQEELNREIKKGQNIRSAEHIKSNWYGNQPFDKTMFDKYLKHEDINNLRGLEIELVYEWNLGDILIFDRSHLHASSSNIKGKKIGLTTFTKK